MGRMLRACGVLAARASRACAPRAAWGHSGRRSRAARTEALVRQRRLGLHEAGEVLVARLEVLHLAADDLVDHLRGHLVALRDLFSGPLHAVVQAVPQRQHVGVLGLAPLLHLAHRVAELLLHDGVLGRSDPVALALDAVRRHLPRVALRGVVRAPPRDREHRAAREALQGALYPGLGPVEDLPEHGARRPPPIVLHGQVRRRLADLLHVVLQRLREA
mmetsp:Transcript_4298/g.14347  ORF Transcript_4298/g.14347 Transcript_4298/m.14347 type:complete len:218 (-) Transcript_4298:592-1245(-)